MSNIILFILASVIAAAIWLAINLFQINEYNLYCSEAGDTVQQQH